MEKQTSSEEKLLKLIRKKDTPKEVDKNVGSKFTEAKAEAKKKDEAKASGGEFLKRVNRLLTLVAPVLLVYVVYSYLDLEQKDMRVIDSEIIESKQGSKLKEDHKSETESFSYYQDALLERNLFESPWEKPKIVKGDDSRASSDLQSQIKIVGIVLDDDPKAIIEDIKTKQTFFLSKGEKINGAMIEEIREDMVIFNYNNERIELVP